MTHKDGDTIEPATVDINSHKKSRNQDTTRHLEPNRQFINFTTHTKPISLITKTDKNHLRHLNPPNKKTQHCTAQVDSILSMEHVVFDVLDDNVVPKLKPISFRWVAQKF